MILTRKQKRLWDEYKKGTSLDIIATVCRYKTNDECMEELKALRWNHYKKTGEKIR